MRERRIMYISSLLLMLERNDVLSMQKNGNFMIEIEIYVICICIMRDRAEICRGLDGTAAAVYNEKDRTGVCVTG